MPKTGTTFTTKDGWTIDAGQTIAATAAWHLKFADDDEVKCAERRRISLAELRCKLQDHRLPPEPVITPEVAAILKKPLPDMEAALKIDGEATEDDLLRLCALTISVCQDYLAVDYVKGSTIYEPPSWFENRRLKLNGALRLAMNAAAAIPATTFLGCVAKGKVISEWRLDPKGDDLNVPIVVSLLRDLGALDRFQKEYPDLCKARGWKPVAKPAQFIEMNDNLERVWARAQA